MVPVRIGLAERSSCQHRCSSTINTTSSPHDQPTEPALLPACLLTCTPTPSPPAYLPARPPACLPASQPACLPKSPAAPAVALPDDGEDASGLWPLLTYRCRGCCCTCEALGAERPSLSEAGRGRGRPRADAGRRRASPSAAAPSAAHATSFPCACCASPWLSETTRRLRG